MIYKGSRYVGENTYRRTLLGETRNTLSLRDIDRTTGSGYVAHVIKDGDRLHNIAFDYWKDGVKNPEDLWWLIADKNIQIDPLKLEPGTTIWIPPVELARAVSEGENVTA